MKRNRVLIFLTAFLLAVVSLLTFQLHYHGIREVLSQFQDRQLSYAKHLSNNVAFFIRARARGLKALASLVSFERCDPKQQKLNIEAYAQQIETVYIKAVSIYDASGTAVCSTDPDPIGLGASDSELFVWARKGENRHKIILAPFSTKSQSLTFVLVTPLYRETPDSTLSKANETFAGVLAFTLDMKEFLASQLGSVDPKMNLDQVWIADSDGTLLFQAQHPEMVSRNIYQQENSCFDCHISFDYVEEILVKGQGTADYEIKGHPKKVAAFAPMAYENVSWVVVVNSPYDEVTGFIKKSLREHLLLLGIVVLAFAVSSALIVRNERMKIKAEEKVAHWQERMSERRKAEEDLQRERDKLKGILNSMKDGVHMVDQQNEMVYTNPVIEKEFGQVKGRKCYEYFHDLSEICSWCRNKEVFAGKTVRWEWFSVKSGKTYDLFDTPVTGPDGGLCKLQIVRDITDRKTAEEALKKSEKQLRSLSSQLLTAQETERKRISRELHDELGQALMVMKLRFNFIEKNLRQDQSELRQECEQGLHYIDQVVENVRRLSRDLSPSILEDFGLSAALRWLVTNFAKSHATKVSLEIMDIDSLLPQGSHVIVYRIIQETLTNVGRHSGASHVSVAIRKETGRVFFLVEDDGTGFNAGEAVTGNPAEKGLGIETMKGRAQMIGGVFEIRSQPGKGTRMTLSLPIC